jgi:hypothetical protein
LAVRQDKIELPGSVYINPPRVPHGVINGPFFFLVANAMEISISGSLALNG